MTRVLTVRKREQDPRILEMAWGWGRKLLQDVKEESLLQILALENGGKLIAQVKKACLAKVMDCVLKY